MLQICASFAKPIFTLWGNPWPKENSWLVDFLKPQPRIEAPGKTNSIFEYLVLFPWIIVYIKIEIYTSEEYHVFTIL